MFRSAASKVMWVGRATVFLVGLAVILALVFGVASTAFAHKGNKGFFHLGHKNVSRAVSTLVKQGPGPALNLMVKAGQPPLKVNSKARVANLNAASAGRADSAASADNATNAQNANTLDNKDSTAFLGKTEKADDADKLDGEDSAAYQKRVSSSCLQNSSIRVVNADGTVACESNAATAGMAGFANNAGNADKLDNKDSTVFGIRTAHAKALAHDCDTPSVWNECAPVTVTVPSGSKYIVSVWSSFSARMPDGISQSVEYCSAGKGPSLDVNDPCITPFAVKNAVWVENPGLTAASSSGDTLNLDPGTYTFFTAIKPPMNQFHSHPNGHVITKVLVRDVANSF